MIAWGASRLGSRWGSRAAYALSIGGALLVLLLGAGASAAAGGSVSGIVRDALDRPLPAADVRLETRDGRVIARTTSDQDGRFSFFDVPPGSYTVVAGARGSRRRARRARWRTRRCGPSTWRWRRAPGWSPSWSGRRGSRTRAC